MRFPGACPRNDPRAARTRGRVKEMCRWPVILDDGMSTQTPTRPAETA
jgi:hypothetical protein